MCGRKYMHLTEISAGFLLLFFFPIHFIKEGGGGGVEGGFGTLQEFAYHQYNPLCFVQ